MKIKVSALVAAAFAALLICNTTPARAGGGMTGGALEITQLANNVQLIESAIQQVQQTQQQIWMYSSMVENMKNLSNVDFANYLNVFSTLQRAISQAQSISYQLGQAEEYFESLYPDYAKITASTTDYSEQQTAWRESVTNICEGNLRVADVAMSSMASDAAMISAISSASRTASGQKAVLQAGNEISTLMLSKLNELKALSAAQVQSQSVYTATQKMEEEAKAQKLKKAYETSDEINLNDNETLTF